MQAIDEAVTLPELKKAVEAMLQFEVKLQNKTETELFAIKNAVDSAIERIQTTVDEAIYNSEQKLASRVENTLNKVYLEHESMMAECDAKMEGMIQPEDGKDADEENIVEKVLARIPEPEIPEVEDETPESIRDLLEELIPKSEDEKLDPRSIKGWEELMKKIEGIASRPTTVANVGRDITDIDISSQLDGVTKTFNIPAVWKIVTVDLSSFPNALRKNIDYTWTPTSITFTSEIEASTSLNTGQTCIITAVTN